MTGSPGLHCLPLHCVENWTSVAKCVEKIDKKM